MDHHIARRLTHDEHGTINAALVSYADEIDDSIEAKVVRDLAEEIISCDVHINATTSESKDPGALSERPMHIRCPLVPRSTGVRWRRRRISVCILARS